MRKRTSVIQGKNTLGVLLQEDTVKEGRKMDQL
jgi:hypothetical protein